MSIFDRAARFLQSLKTSGSRQRLVENFLSLSLLEAGNYLLPLITFPYLVRVLGPEKWGVVTFAQVFVQYFVLVTDYGFNFSATREISVSRDDVKRVSVVFSTVMFIKTMLLLASLAVVVLCVVLFDKFRQEYLVYLFSMGMVLGRVLFPMWFFQGIEKMRFITILHFLARLVFTVLILTTIKETSDYVYVPLLNSIGLIIAGLLGLWIAVAKFGVTLRMPDMAEVRSQAKTGWHMFLSSISIQVYKSADILLLGFFASELTLGSYAIAKRLVDIANTFNAIVSQSIYPQMSIKIKHSLAVTARFLQRVSAFVFTGNVAIALAYALLAEPIIRLVSGEVFDISVQSLRLLAVVPLIIAVTVPSGQFLLGARLDAAFFKATALGAFVAVVLNLALIPRFSFWGACVSVLAAEMAVSVVMYANFRRHFRRMETAAGR